MSTLVLNMILTWFYKTQTTYNPVYLLYAKLISCVSLYLKVYIPMDFFNEWERILTLINMQQAEPSYISSFVGSLPKEVDLWFSF